MQLRHFTLDALTETVYGEGQYFFYYNREKILQAWTVSKRDDLKIEIKSFKEASKGSMSLSDLYILELPLNLKGINESGLLIFETEKGILECSADSRQIRITAREKTIKEANESEVHKTESRFPGMIQCDSCELNDIRLSRFVSHSMHEEHAQIFREFFLLLQATSKAKMSKTNDEIIIAGNPRIDKNLRLIQANQEELFHIPVNIASLEYQAPNKNVKIIGWNQKEVEILDVIISCKTQKMFTIINRKNVKTNGALLEEMSTRCLEHSQRLIIWRDLLNPCSFYCLQ